MANVNWSQAAREYVDYANHAKDRATAALYKQQLAREKFKDQYTQDELGDLKQANQLTPDIYKGLFPQIQPPPLGIPAPGQSSMGGTPNGGPAPQPNVPPRPPAPPPQGMMMPPPQQLNAGMQPNNALRNGVPPQAMGNMPGLSGAMSGQPQARPQQPPVQAPPPMPPQGFRPMPTEQAAPPMPDQSQLESPPQPAQQGQKIPTMQDVIGQLQKNNVPPQLWEKVMANVAPVIANAQKAENDSLKREIEFYKAQNTAKYQSGKEERLQGQGDQKIQIAKAKLDAQIKGQIGGNNLTNKEYEYPRGSNGQPDMTQPPIGVRAITKSGKIVRVQSDDASHDSLSMDGGQPSLGGATAKEGKAAGIGSRESVFVNRTITAAEQAASDLSNVVELPITSSSGFFGGRGAPSSIYSAGRESLMNKMTSQEVQDYNVLSTGFQRSLSAIEAAGLAPSGTLSHQMDAVIFKEGDSQLTKLRKLAQTRQIVESGMEPLLNNPRLPKEQKDEINKIVSKIKQAVPYTNSELTKLQVAQEKNPDTTLNDVMKKINKGASSNKNAKGWELHVDAKGNKAYVSPDGKQFEEVK